jgi:hypothetical protein
MTKARRSSLIFKLSLFFLSTLISLSITEIGLRLAGDFIITSKDDNNVSSLDELEKYNRDANYELYSTGNEKIKRPILSIGDSFTNAGNVSAHQTYPFHLFELLQESNFPAPVLNLGKCEDNTFLVYKRLKELIEKTPKVNLPQSVIILIGSADMFNRSNSFGIDNDGNLPIINVIPNWFYSLRLFKVYRFISMNLRGKYLIASAGSIYHSTSKKDVVGFELLYKKTQQYLEKKPGAKKIPKHFLSVISQEYLELTKKYGYDLSKIDHFMSAYIYINFVYYSRNLKHEEVVRKILKIARLNPHIFWNTSYKQHGYFLTQSFQVQSDLTSEEILQSLKEMINIDPSIKESKLFLEFENFVINKNKIEAEVNQARLITWDKIVHLLEGNNIKLVLMNYPSSFKSANKILNEVSRKYDIPLMDNHKYFSQFQTSKLRSQYIADDDHLTPKGYQVMANNLFQFLKANKLLL